MNKESNITSNQIAKAIARLEGDISSEAVIERHQLDREMRRALEAATQRQATDMSRLQRLKDQGYGDIAQKLENL